MLRSKKILSLLVSICIVVGTLAGIPLAVSAANPADAITIIATNAANDLLTTTLADLTNAGAIGLNPNGVDNLAAYQAAISASTANGVDTIEEIQALVYKVNLAQAVLFISTYVGATDLTRVQLTDAGITSVSVLDDNLNVYTTAIKAAALAAKNTTPVIQYLINNNNVAQASQSIAAIKGYCAANVATALTTIQLNKAGVSFLSANLEAYKAAIVALPNDATLLDTLIEIQQLVDTVNAATVTEAARLAEIARVAILVVISGYAANDNADALTVANIRAAAYLGSTDAILLTNLPAIKLAIALATVAQVDTTSKIKVLIDGVNSAEAIKLEVLNGAITAIQGYAANDDASLLSIQQLKDAGVTAALVMNANLAAYRVAVAASTAALTSNPVQIQLIVTDVNGVQSIAAINAIQAYTASTVSSLTIDQLAKAYVSIASAVVADNAIDANLARYKLAIGAATSITKNTTVLIQGIVTSVNTKIESEKTGIAKIEAFTPATVAAGADPLTILMLTDCGVTGTVIGNLANYQVQIGAAAVGAADSLLEIQAIINSVNAAANVVLSVAVISNYAVIHSAVGLTIAQLTAAGVTSVAGNIAAYTLAIGASTGPLTDTTAEIQTLITAINAQEVQVAFIAGYAANDDASALTTAQLTAAGVTAIDANLGAYKTAIAATTSALTDTKAEIQTVIDAVNTAQAVVAIAAIDAYGAGAAGLTMNQLSIAGVTTAIAANLDAYKVAIGAAAALAADTIGEINAIIATVNSNCQDASVVVIRNYAANDNANDLTLGQLLAAGVPTATAIQANLEAYKVAIAEATLATADTSGKIIAIITSTNTAEINKVIAVIEAYTATTASSLTIAQLKFIGVTLTVDANIAAYQAGIGAAIALAADTLGEIQGLIDTANTAEALKAAIAVITGYATSANAGGLTDAQIIAAGVLTSVNDAAHLAEYKAEIAASAATLADTTAKINTIILKSNAKITAITTIDLYAGGAYVAIMSDLVVAGVTGAINANSANYLAAINGVDASTVAKIQTIVNTVNGNIKAAAVVTISEYASNDNATALTIAQLTAAGVTGALDINLGIHANPSTGYVRAIEAALLTTSDTTAKIQAIIDTVNAAKGSAEITGISVGTLSGSILAGRTDPLFPSVINVKVAPSVTTIVSENITISAGAKMTLYVNSDFATGATASAAISGSTTTLYAKVVCENGTSTKYFKLVYTVEDPSAKYTLAATQQFTKTGSLYVAKVSIARGNAVTLSDAKLYAIYTLADGSQMYQTLEVGSATSQDIVVSKGFTKVQVILVNGLVDWSVGFDGITFQSNSITLTMPVA